MTSPLALTVEEVWEILDEYRYSPLLDAASFIAPRLNALIESKRQSYMSTDRARAEYDPDGWRKAGE